MFLEIKRALAPHADQAERDVEMLIGRISQNIPDRFKLFALTWYGFFAVHTAAILCLMVSSLAIALVFGKGTLPVAWFTVNLIVFVMVYNIVFLARWDEEGWHTCPNCDQPVRAANFCAFCGIAQR
jgi:hypothetical protein